MKRKSILLILILSMGILYAQDSFRTDIPAERIAGGAENYFMNPKWSPDGQTIAFSGSNYSGLWMIDLVSNEIRQISDDQGVGFGYRWSEDGSAILVRSTRQIGKKSTNAIKLIDILSTKETVLVDYSERITSVPVYGKGGTEIKYRANNQIKTVSVGKLAKTTKLKRSCYIDTGRMIITSLSSEPEVALNPVQGSEYINAAISPDGSRLVFEIMGGNLYTINTDGSELTDLGRGYRAQWSPNSKYVIYMITEDDGYQYTSSDLYISDPYGTHFIKLTDTSNVTEMNPVWSPDGSTVAFHDHETGTIWVKRIAE